MAAAAEMAKGPHLRSIDYAETMTSKRRSRRSFELAGGGVFAAASELGDGAACSGEWARRDAVQAKQIGQPAGAWRRRVHDGLTHGANAGVRPPLGARGLSSVGHD